eukprot:gene830-903_t
MKKPVLTLDASLVQDDIPLEVAPKIFVGSIHAAFNLEALVANGITHILNASRLPPTFPKQFTYLSVEIRDKDGSNILSCIPTTNIFIEAGVEHGGVLVHCFGGKSRSPAFIAAYLMSCYHWTFDEAFRTIKSARPSIEINLGFEYQLRAYAAAKYDVYIAQQLLLRARIRELHFLRGDAAVLNSDKNVSDHLTVSKLSMANLLGNQANLQQRLELISKQRDSQANPNPREALSQQKSNNKRSFEDVKQLVSKEDQDEEDGSRMDVETAETTECSSPDVRVPSNSVEGMEESTDSLASQQPDGLIPVSRSAKLPKGYYGEDVIKSVYSVEEKDTYLSPSNEEVDRANTGSDNGVICLPDMQEANNNNNKGSKSQRWKGAVGGSYRIGLQSTRNSISSAISNSSHHHNVSRSTVDTKNPCCRLSRPGSSVIRVIPPLRGLEREFQCSWCNAAVFQLANVIRPDLDIMPMVEDFINSLQLAANHRREDGDAQYHPEEHSAVEDAEEEFLQSTKRQGGFGRPDLCSAAIGDEGGYRSSLNHAILHAISPKGLSVGSEGRGFSGLSKSNQPLPPIAPRSRQGSIVTSVSHDDINYHANSSKGGDYRFDGRSSNVVPSSSSIVAAMEMDVDQDYHTLSVPFVPPLMTSRANKGNKGFQFDSLDAPSLELPATRRPSLKSDGSPAKDIQLPLHLQHRSSTPRTLPSLDHAPSSSSSSAASSYSSSSAPPVATSTAAVASNGSQLFMSIQAQPNSPRLQPIQLNNTVLSGQLTINQTAHVTNIQPSHNATASDSMTTPPKSFFAPLYPGLNPPNHGRTCVDISPRVLLPPPREGSISSPATNALGRSSAGSVHSNVAMAIGRSSFLDRPASAEKRRWLARVSLLREGDVKVAQLAEQDDVVARALALNDEKYFYLEYLDSMGKEIFQTSKDYGDILCPGCSKVLGCWNWTPSLRLLKNGKLEAPLFLIDKNVVHQLDVDFDATPSGTPRLQDDLSVTNSPRIDDS